jgi:hypothetical protein
VPPGRGRLRVILNEYTRREEIFWTLVTVCILVPATVGASVALWRARGQGPHVPDPTAIEALKRAETAESEFAKARCSKVATKLGEEVTLFKQRAAKAEKEAKDAADKARKPTKERGDYAIPTQPAQSVLKQAKALIAGNCKQLTQEAAGVSQRAAAGWSTAETIAALNEGGDASAQQTMARALLVQVNEVQRLVYLASHTEAARAAVEKKLATAREDATTKLKHVEPAEGLLPFKLALGIGVLLPVIALVLSYVSVRSASMRRAKLLVALRRFANTPEAGLQAAAIVRLAAHHNGGEPGMVLGSALGGLLAALLAPSDNPNVFMADLFVAGAMGGLLVGLGAQWVLRTVFATSRWRNRTQELGEVEKPTIPVALVLGGVSPGLEKQFLRYFEALPIGDAAVWVQKVATQAEEQILAAADAAANSQYASHGSPQGQSPWA